MLLLLYNDILYRPLLNLLVFFYNFTPGHDIGVVIIILTILIRLALAPSFHKSLKGQKAMNDLQPKLTELREKYKGNKEAEAKAMMELYKEHKINPLSSCLPILIQLPIIIALYQVFRQALGGHDLVGLYSFIHKPDSINPYFLHFVNLAKAVTDNGKVLIPNLILALLAGATQFWQAKMMMPKTTGKQDATAKAMSMQMTYVLPIVSIVVAWKLPAGLPLYWVVTTLFAVAQQYYIMRNQQPKVV